MGNNSSAIYIYAPCHNIPSGGIGVLMRQARILKDNNFNVKVIYSPKPIKHDGKGGYIYEHFSPDWLEFDYSDIDIEPIGMKSFKDNNGNTINPKNYRFDNKNDIIIIPEGLADFMEKTVNVKAKRVVLAQSWLYILNSLRENKTWKDYKIYDVISVSEGITDFIKRNMGDDYYFYKLNQSINTDIFKPSENKIPQVVYNSPRDSIMNFRINNIIKIFKLKNPIYKNVKFVELKGFSREEYAKKINESMFCLYMDDIAGFGTLPIESMAANTHVIGFKNIGNSEYVNINNGFWVYDFDDQKIVDILSDVFDKFMNNYFDKNDYLISSEKMTVSKYTKEIEEKDTVNIFNKLLEN